MTAFEIKQLVEKQADFFASQQTKSIDFRKAQLKKLQKAIKLNEAKISEALYLDLRKSTEEAYLTEISIVLQEIDHHLKHLDEWSRPKATPTPLHLFPSSSKIIFEPLGKSLIIAPWNYPFQLVINPLIGAISAGCTAVLKPSPDTPHTATLLQKIISSTFPSEYIGIVLGGIEENQLLLKQRFDLIFFTGSTRVGKIVAKAAAENLTPTILELGGKSPAIVHLDANINIAAKRIAWGKTINAGQTCIAPDYVLVHQSVKEQLIEKMKVHIMKMYGEQPVQSPYYPRIVHDAAFKRLEGFLKNGTIRFGGQTDSLERLIAPTIIDGVGIEDPIMQEEIFGPILPILTYNQLDEVMSIINQGEKPLALYYFGSKKTGNLLLDKTSSGGACINDTLLHIANDELPFGGVGHSGMGAYHGKQSFLAFSHQRAVLQSSTRFDLAAKYPPFKWFQFIKRFI